MMKAKELKNLSVEELTKKLDELKKDLMKRAYSLEKTLMMGKAEGKRRRGWQKMRWLDSIINSMDTEFEQTLGDSKGQRRLVCCRSRGHKDLDVT